MAEKPTEEPDNTKMNSDIFDSLPEPKIKLDDVWPWSLNFTKNIKRSILDSLPSHEHNLAELLPCTRRFTTNEYFLQRVQNKQSDGNLCKCTNCAPPNIENPCKKGTKNTRWDESDGGDNTNNNVTKLKRFPSKKGNTSTFKQRQITETKVAKRKYTRKQYVGTTRNLRSSGNIENQSGIPLKLPDESLMEAKKLEQKDAFINPSNDNEKQTKEIANKQKQQDAIEKPSKENVNKSKQIVNDAIKQDDSAVSKISENASELKQVVRKGKKRILSEIEINTTPEDLEEIKTTDSKETNKRKREDENDNNPSYRVQREKELYAVKRRRRHRYHKTLNQDQNAFGFPKTGNNYDFMPKRKPVSVNLGEDEICINPGMQTASPNLDLTLSEESNSDISTYSDLLNSSLKSMIVNNAPLRSVDASDYNNFLNFSTISNYKSIENHISKKYSKLHKELMNPTRLRYSLPNKRETSTSDTKEPKSKRRSLRHL